ncbi:ATP-dependent helicase, partial [candidate division WOR-3 bacterium]|nr:ATP-dependent helicase [candidate division WOR-3 bacterium]
MVDGTGSMAAGRQETGDRHDWLRDLNPQQLQAVQHGEGPLLVIAGAGTGKTKTLAYRVAWLIQRGVPAERLLLLTFTRRAAEEMLRRAEAACRQATGKVWGGTFHAIANRLLRLYGRAVGISAQFTVMDESDSADLLGLLRSRLGYASKEQRFPRKTTIRAIYSRMANSREPLQRVLKREYPWCVHAEKGLGRIFSEYTRRKQERLVMDYDDLLLYWNELLDVPEVQRAVEARFEHVLVDEYQDTNVIQAEVLQRLRRGNRNITVVGDDAQSIYSFRAATIRNILDFPQQFPGTTTVTLEQNYRSVQPILDVGNAVMAEARFRYTKNLFSGRTSEQRPVLVVVRDDFEQTRVVCEKILEHLDQGIKLQEQAVLFRAGHHSDQLEVELAKRDIPFHKYGGLRFLEAAHVKDLVAFLRLLENPKDDMSWFRVLEMLEGVGPRTVERFLGELEALAFDVAKMGEIEMPPAAREGFGRLCDLLLAVHERGERLPVTAQVERVRFFYEPMVPLLYDNPNPRLRDLEQLQVIAQRYRLRADFLADLTLDPPESTGDWAGPPHKDEDWLT